MSYAISTISPKNSLFVDHLLVSSVLEDTQKSRRSGNLCEPRNKIHSFGEADWVLLCADSPDLVYLVQKTERSLFLTRLRSAPRILTNTIHMSIMRGPFCCLGLLLGHKLVIFFEATQAFISINDNHSLV